MQIKYRFPAFRKQNIIYLDNGATTQIPDAVERGVEQALELRGNPGRSSHQLARKSAELLEEAREAVARFIGASTDEIIFTGNTTDSINSAVDSISHNIKSGDIVLLSVAEHHSNLLPYLRLARQGAKIKLIGIRDGMIDIAELKNNLSSKVRVVALGQCSNVLGNINPVEKIGSLIKKYNPDIFYFVDGAQAVAHLPVNVKKIKCDFYAFSGHKMYGPDGIGVLYASKKVHHKMNPVKPGGATVSNVAVTYGKDKDVISPDYSSVAKSLEGGTPNVSGAYGLSRAISFIGGIGLDEIRLHEINLLRRLLEGLQKIEDIVVFGPQNPADRIGLLSFGLNGYSLKELGAHLADKKICVRFGTHCAFPLADKLGQESLRVSFGIYNDENDVDLFLGELKLFLDKKRGIIRNPNFELLRDKTYYRNLAVINSADSLTDKIMSAIYNPEETEVVIMAGHFLAIPDLEQNKFWPSVVGILPDRLHGLMEEFGMTSFPLFTWKTGCRVIKKLKSSGIKAKLSIIANDTTGINELRLSDANKKNKTADQYRQELLALFKEDGDLPKEYVKILETNGLSKSDVLKNGSDYFFRETVLRANFKKFIHNNGDYFDDVIAYTMDQDEEKIDLAINILDNQEIKTCTFNTFHSKTGGKFCIAELTEFIAEIFGKAPSVSFKYLNEKVQKPKSKARHKIFVILSPAMCESAINRAGELYIKLFLQGAGEGSFKFFDVPFGPYAEKSLAVGSPATYLSDKDNLEVLDVYEEPDFPELWRLTEYKLLYNADAYLEEMERLLKKLGLNKKSKLLDTCVGPGFFSTELLKAGYNLVTSDKSQEMIKPFENRLKELGIKHQTVISSWLELGKKLPKNSFDFIYNRGNTIIYADGGWNEVIKVNPQKSLEAITKTMKVYYDLLKPGGYFYVDKFSDVEIPEKKVVARLNIKEDQSQKDIVFYVERRPEDNVRFAQMLLRDKEGGEEGLPNMAYDLSEDEMEKCLRAAGFSKIEKIKLKTERHFVVWLAKK